jgi:ribonuclease J
MRHAELAKDAGVADMIVVENGDTVEIEADAPLRKSGRVGVGKVATSNREELSEDVLRERATLGRGGVLFVALALDRRGALTSPPEIIQRGIAHLDQVATKHVSQAVARAVSELSHVAREDDTSVMETARSAARRTAEAETGGRPMVTVAVLRS